MLDTDGVILSLYFQKITSRFAKEFRDASFGSQFAGLTLKDFYSYDVKTGKSIPPGPVDRIKNPSPDAERDFRATLRAAKKNLILVDEFVIGNKYLEYHKKIGD